VDTITINNWERNRCQPKLYLIPKIVEFLGYSPLPTEAKHTSGGGVRAYRLMHGLSQKKLAKILKIDPTTVARWENGKSRPRERLRKRFGAAVGLFCWCHIEGSPSSQRSEACSFERNS
jgi:transcriptional regulator with XRE-family HTH domain